MLLQRVLQENPKNWAAQEMRSLGREALLSAPPHMCYHVKFGSSTIKGVYTHRKDPQNWGALGHTLGWERD